jgi:hypothetical protein
LIQYELLHYINGLLVTVSGALGGIYALRTLKMLYRTPEVLESQRRIWVPILVAGGFFFVSGIFHFVEHVFPSICELNLVSEYSLVAGFSFSALSIYRYWRLQKEYSEVKHRALQKIKS